MDKMGEEVGEVEVLEILSPVFQVIDKNEGDVMLVQGKGKAVKMFVSVGKEGQSERERFQDRRFALGQGTEAGNGESFDPVGMTEALFPEAFPRLEVAVVEVIPEGVTGREE
jgi:hypothetical protein